MYQFAALLMLDWFQFQSGAIKSSSGGFLSATFSCFNSKVVRLKEKPPRSEATGQDGFQFQSGAIKSPSSFNQFVWRIEFQFQSGAIKRRNKASKSTIAALFQFQSGAIKSTPFQE